MLETTHRQYFRSMVAMTLPAGFDARAIETGDAEVWAGLLAAAAVDLT